MVERDRSGKIPMPLFVNQSRSVRLKTYEIISSKRLRLKIRSVGSILTVGRLIELLTVLDL